MKATFVKRVTDVVPSDPSLSRNGGDYYYYTDVYRLDNGRLFSLLNTSSEFDYCQISGVFAETCLTPLTVDGEAIQIGGKPFYVRAAKWLANQGFVSPHILDSESI